MKLTNEKAAILSKSNYEAFQREFPRKLALQEKNLLKKFKRGKSGGALDKLQKLYAFMDKVYGIVGMFTPCKNGCNYCCNYPISVSNLEVRYIEERMRFKRVQGLPALDFKGRCPFLVDSTCSIYACRPFVCRRHITFNPTAEYCRLNVPMQMLRFSEIDKVYDYILETAGNTDICDIRNVFTGINSS